jgi:hypothetical protein
MVAKIFAGVLAVAVMGTGGYVYWQSAMDDSGCTGCPSALANKATPSCCSEEEETPSCCQSGSRAGMLEAFAKTCETPDTQEVLAIEPREVK